MLMDDKTRTKYMLTYNYYESSRLYISTLYFLLYLLTAKKNHEFRFLILKRKFLIDLHLL